MTSQFESIRLKQSVPKKVMIASFTGTALEYYDFFIYGTMAALVFGALFFPSHDPVAGTLAAFATFAVGFAARPIGSILFGHLGDRLGRRKTLVLSLGLMGGATLGIGLLPTFTSVGVLAPLLLVLLRLLQGLALGGEWGGAALMLVENAPAGRKSTYGSIVQMGAPAGLMLATAATSFSVAVSGNEFMVWGWRLPFWLSILLLAISFWIRISLAETSEFAKTASSKARESKAPALLVFKNHWKDLILACGVAAPGGALFSIVTTYTLSYTVDILKQDRGSILNVTVAASAVYLVSIPLFGRVADKWGSYSVITLGAISTAIFAFFYFQLLGTGAVFLVFLAVAVALAGIHAALQAPQAEVFAAQFDVSLRYTGVALSQAIPTTIVAGTTPFLATYLYDLTKDTNIIAVYLVSLGLIGAACSVAMRRKALIRSREPIRVASYK
ncbi:MFS transporter [Pseudarthrobacter sp. AG30]|uniref:MFS transporter n=1 Tax=Pseudarthrobacter sp. AG30 TaxID=2249742 RepID=UPI000D6E69F2|nr:MFS transporter [Pseudarthrobacter sp. AG30]RAX15125.1 MFS transporter [Pseudarthrobacter sp. AG30]